MTKPVRLLPVLAGALALAVTVFSVALAQEKPSNSDGSVSPEFTGGCTAEGTITGYGTIDPAVSGGVYTVPKSGSAAYTGSVPVEGEDRSTNGRVEIALPLGLPGITLRSWETDDTDASSHSGTVTWDIPDIVPGNIQMKVDGFHQDEGVRCEGRVVVELDGNGLLSTVGILSLLGTVAALGGLIWASIPKREVP